MIELSIHLWRTSNLPIRMCNYGDNRWRSVVWNVTVWGFFPRSIVLNNVFIEGHLYVFEMFVEVAGGFQVSSTRTSCTDTTGLRGGKNKPFAFGTTVKSIICNYRTGTMSYQIHRNGPISLQSIKTFVGQQFDIIEKDDNNLINRNIKISIVRTWVAVDVKKTRVQI